MHYVIGLGNPENEYGNTRHNAGKIFVKTLGELAHVTEWKKDPYNKITLATGNLKDVSVNFVLSDTYMNESGLSVGSIFKKEHKTILIVHDDLDLAIGTYKISRNKGDGGHNGVTSIQKTLPNEEIIRLRLGISPVDTEGAIRRISSPEQAEYVLKPFSENEKEKMLSLVPEIFSMLQVLCIEGVDKAMTLYNK